MKSIPKAVVIGVLLAWVAPYLMGCLPIPVRRTAVVVPEAEVAIIDGESGAPVEGAVVELRRIHMGPPPSELLGTWEATSDDQGWAYFEEETERETHMPLMMHGVPQRQFTLCVRHEGYETEISDRERQLVETGGQLDDEKFPWVVEFEMTPGEATDCPDGSH